MKRTYYLGGDAEAESLDVERVSEPEDARTRFQITRGDTTREVDVLRDATGLHLLLDGKSYRCDVVRDRASGRTLVSVEGRAFEVPMMDAQRYRRRQRSGGGNIDGGPEVRSPMAGKIVAVSVAVGDRVEAGQGLVIVEAMKMENDIKSTRAAIVEDIHVEVGQIVEVGSLLLRLGDVEEED